MRAYVNVSDRNSAFQTGRKWRAWFSSLTYYFQNAESISIHFWSIVKIYSNFHTIQFTLSINVCVCVCVHILTHSQNSINLFPLSFLPPLNSRCLCNLHKFISIYSVSRSYVNLAVTKVAVI